MEVSGHLHAPAALPPGKEPLVPLDLNLTESKKEEYGEKCIMRSFLVYTIHCVF
jgi:hypothetical protein